MVQIAPSLVIKEEKLKGQEVASYLQSAVNELAQQGWEFFRVDEMWVSVDANVLLGIRETRAPVRFHVITFRRERRAAKNPGV